MLLHKKLTVIIFVVVMFTVFCVFLASNFVIGDYLNTTQTQYQKGLVASITNDIDTFENILESIESRWDKELEASLPTLAQQLFNVSKTDPQQVQDIIETFKETSNVSDVYLIDSNLVITASTLSTEVGLDMRSFSKQYTSMLLNLLNAGKVVTHRMTHATDTGVLKKYGYFSLPGSNIIVNADITVKARLATESNEQLSRFLFGDYVTNLENKYQMIKSIDLILLSERDAYSLFFEGRKIDSNLARMLWQDELPVQTNPNLLQLPIELESYKDLGFKTVLKIEFDPSPIETIQAQLIMQLLVIAFLVTLLAYLLLQLTIRKFVLVRFIDLLTQINVKQVGDKNQINVAGNDEITQVGNAVNSLMMSFESQLQENKKLLEISNTDSLTELSNRRHFDEIMEIEWAQAQRDKSDLTIIMLDIDSFKAFNDTYGHENGDVCLKSLARFIKQQLNRPRDFAARYGGEEFMCLLPETDAKGAKLAAVNICQGIRSLQIKHETSGVAEYVTASLGCLTVNGRHELDIKDLINKVDLALYEAKNSGRNTISLVTIV
jgi:diguanylate cyclase (GGDEF)-like protein